MKSLETASLMPCDYKLLDFTKIPEHIAIIMDGNRRWAKKLLKPSVFGHTKGADTLTEIVKVALDLKIKILTVFAFSTENWLRSNDEIQNLMNLFSIYLKSQINFMIKEKISLNIIGDLSKCPLFLQKDFQDTIFKTKDGDRLKLVIAINYGSKDEIKRAVVKIVDDIESKKIKKEDITEELIRSYLDTKDYKDPDLLIRTSGEKRLSNFLLWQLSYTEIYTTETLWPDFNKDEFFKAILEYQNRKRRLGGA
jgi:undecaprenyl diphosphate synthase